MRDLDRLHNGVKNPRGSDMNIPISDYPGRLVALFQERNADTSDVINAYREKKKLTLPLEELIAIAGQIAIAAIRNAG